MSTKRKIQRMQAMKNGRKILPRCCGVVMGFKDGYGFVCERCGKVRQKEGK